MNGFFVRALRCLVRPGCLLAAIALGAVAGCAPRTVCDDAVDKLNSCDLPSALAPGACDTVVIHRDGRGVSVGGVRIGN